MVERWLGRWAQRKQATTALGECAKRPTTAGYPSQATGYTSP